MTGIVKTEVLTKDQLNFFSRKIFELAPKWKGQVQTEALVLLNALRYHPFITYSVLGGGVEALCVQMGFYTDISRETRCKWEIYRISLISILPWIISPLFYST